MKIILPSFSRATAKEIYATLHLVCDEDVLLSACTNHYGQEIQKILKSYCVRYFTIQFEYVPSSATEKASADKCVYGLRRRSRGHVLKEPSKEPRRSSVVIVQ